MLGIDTNVLVRYLVRDDEAQFEKANRLIKRGVAADEPVFVSLPVLFETEWVLRSRYSLDKSVIVEAISSLLDTTEMVFEDEPAIEESLKACREERSASFADCLIGAHNRRVGCRATATFDVRAARVPGFIAL